MELTNSIYKVVYGVYKNADMTEGRGPMVLDKLFENEEKAWAYANSQPGIMGRFPVKNFEKVTWRDIDNGDWQVKELKLIV